MKKFNDKFTIISLYVDDILIARNDLEYMMTIKSWLSMNFDIKDMSETNYILGIKIKRDHSKKFLTLSQEHYI